MATFDEMDRRLAAMPAVVDRELRHAMTASLLLIEASARSNVAYDTGRLAGSITHTITGAGPTLEGRVGPSVRYGASVEFGRRAGARMPPVDALMGWVGRHPRGRGTRRQQAFALARSIQRRGIRPRPFLRPAYRSNRAAINRLFARAGGRVIATLRGR
jgi:hypothetical protein